MDALTMGHQSMAHMEEAAVLDNSHRTLQCVVKE
jgi:hypothetical protein